MVDMCGLYFALRSESEHRQLKDSDIEVVERPGEIACIAYNESTSKNNLRGLKNRKIEPKHVMHYATVLTRSVALSICLRNIMNTTHHVTMLTVMIGVNTLHSTVARLCERDGT